jgi:hypothetical protein
MTTPATNSPRVTELHKPSSLGKSARLGRWFLALILVSRAVGFGVGCGPSAGPASDCTDQGCHTDCHDAGTLPTFVPAPMCNVSTVASDACAPNESTVRCTGAASSMPSCTVVTRDTLSSGAVMCCPSCVRLASPLFCGRPAVDYDCDDPHTPAETVPSLRCALYYQEGHPARSEYCCAESEACFWTGEYPSVCGDAGRSYACTGSATPAEAGRRCSAAPGAGAPGRYCCDDPPGDGGGAGDVGAGADATNGG